jgi:hypothetical protein
MRKLSLFAFYSDISVTSIEKQSNNQSLLYIWIHTLILHAFFFPALLEVELRALHLLGKHSTTWAWLQSSFLFLSFFETGLLHQGPKG